MVREFVGILFASLCALIEIRFLLYEVREEFQLYVRRYRGASRQGARG